MSTHSTWIDFCNGAISVTGGIVGSQPFTNLTSGTYAGEKVRFRRLFAGWLPNAVTGAPTEGMAFLFYHQLKKNRELSDWQDMGLAFAAGFTGGPINAYGEYVMNHQYFNGGTCIANMRKIGLSAKGTLPAGIRDGIFTCAVLPLDERVKKLLSPWIANEPRRDLAAGMTTGIFAGWFSSPFNRMKTLQQMDIEGVCTTFLNTGKWIVQKEGVRGFFKGAHLNVLSTGATICLTTMFKDHVPKYLVDIRQFFA